MKWELVENLRYTTEYFFFFLYYSNSSTLRWFDLRIVLFERPFTKQLSSPSIEGGLDAHPRAELLLAWSAEKFPPSGATPVPCTVVMETPLVSPYYYCHYLLDGVATLSPIDRSWSAVCLHPLC